MYSDEGVCKVAASNAGCTLPVMDMGDMLLNAMPDFNPKMASFLETAYEICFNSNLLIRMNGRAAISALLEPTTCYEVMFGSVNANDRTRATVAYNTKKSIWSANNHAKWYTEMQAKGYATVENPAV